MHIQLVLASPADSVPRNAGLTEQNSGFLGLCGAWYLIILRAILPEGLGFAGPLGAGALISGYTTFRA